MRNKNALEFGFEWLFAVMIGGLVIFLAIYAASKFIETGNLQKGSEVGKEIGILLTPFETGLEIEKTNKITTKEETTIYNDCSSEGNFGVQKISAGVKSGFGDKVVKPGAISTYKNRYLFSESSVTGKEFYVLSKLFEFPFKVGDLIIVWSEKQKYCFVDLGSYPEVKEDIKELRLKNILNVSSTRDCPADSKKVCFGGTDRECDILVNGNSAAHRESGGDKVVYYSSTDNNALLYAAIFSKPELYDCQIKRLMKRALNIAKLYKDKSGFLEIRGCGAPGLNSYFISYENYVNGVANNANNPDITRAEQAAEELGRRNGDLICPIF